jgi:RHS repeat-associated protein
MQYDALGRRTDLLDADRGHTTTTYDAFGEPLTELDVNGQMHILSRDPIGRTVVDFSTQDGVATYQWDTAPYGVGKIAIATSADNIASTYNYDRFGRNVETSWHIRGQDFAIDRGLDDFGRIHTLQYPAVGGERLSVTYGFDAIGQVSSVTGSDPAAPLSWNGTAWDTDGQLNTETLSDGEQTTRVHDPARAWLNQILTTSSSGNVQQLTFDHDPSGNVNGRHDQLLGTNEVFEHDFLNRIDKWTFTVPGGNSWTTTYDIDDLGNIQSRTMTGVGAPPAQIYDTYGTRDGQGNNPTSPGLHAVTSINGQAYGYDQEGNQVSAPGRSVTYTSFSLPKSVTENAATTHFRYDANHQRAVKRSPGGGSTVYVGGTYEKRTDSTGNVTHVFFVLAGSRIVGQIEWTEDGSGNVNGHNAVYFHDDHLGSIETITGPTTATTHMKYEPFGQRINPLDPTKGAQAPADVTDGFTDQQHDDDLGLVNMQGRIYDPQVARFVSADPFVPAPLGSQGFNRYSYVANSPLSFVDPTGFIYDPSSPGHSPCSFNPGVGAVYCQPGTMASYGPNDWGNNVSGSPGYTPGPSPDPTAVPLSDSDGTRRASGPAGAPQVDFGIPASAVYGTPISDPVAQAMCDEAGTICGDEVTVVARAPDDVLRLPPVTIVSSAPLQIPPITIVSKRPHHALTLGVGFTLEAGIFLGLNYGRSKGVVIDLTTGEMTAYDNRTIANAGITQQFTGVLGASAAAGPTVGYYPDIADVWGSSLDFGGSAGPIGVDLFGSDGRLTGGSFTFAPGPFPGGAHLLESQTNAEPVQSDWQPMDPPLL